MEAGSSFRPEKNTCIGHEETLVLLLYSIPMRGKREELGAWQQTQILANAKLAQSTVFVQLIGLKIREANKLNNEQIYIFQK